MCTVVVEVRSDEAGHLDVNPSRADELHGGGATTDIARLVS